MNSRTRRRRLAKMEDLEARQLLTCDLGVEPNLVADLDCDDTVGFSDFLLLSNAFGKAVDPAGSGADIDGDGMVAFEDFAILSENFGRTANDLTAGLTPEICEDVMRDFKNLIMPGVTQWHSPYFHAFYPVGNSYPSILGMRAYAFLFRREVSVND